MLPHGRAGAQAVEPYETFARRPRRNTSAACRDPADGSRAQLAVRSADTEACARRADASPAGWRALDGKPARRPLRQSLHQTCSPSRRVASRWKAATGHLAPQA